MKLCRRGHSVCHAILFLTMHLLFASAWTRRGRVDGRYRPGHRRLLLRCPPRTLDEDDVQILKEISEEVSKVLLGDGNVTVSVPNPSSHVRGQAFRELLHVHDVEFRGQCVRGFGRCDGCTLRGPQLFTVRRTCRSRKGQQDFRRVPRTRAIKREGLFLMKGTGLLAQHGCQPLTCMSDLSVLAGRSEHVRSRGTLRETSEVSIVRTRSTALREV